MPDSCIRMQISLGNSSWIGQSGQLEEKHPQHHNSNGCEGGKCKISQTKRAFRSNIYFHFCGNDAYMLMNIFNKMNSSRAHRSPLPPSTHTHRRPYNTHTLHTEHWICSIVRRGSIALFHAKTAATAAVAQRSTYIYSQYLWCGTKANAM